MKKREFIDGIRDLLDEYDGAKAVRGEIEGLSLERCGLELISITDAKQFNEWIDDLVKTFNVKLDDKEASDKCCGGCESDEPDEPIIGNINVIPKDVYMLKSAVNFYDQFSDERDNVNYLRNFISEIDASFKRPSKL